MVQTENDYAVWLATGLQPGLTYQIARDLDIEGLVLTEPLFELIRPIFDEAYAGFDPYGITEIPAAGWLLIGQTLRERGRAGVPVNRQAADCALFIADWLEADAQGNLPLRLYGI